MTHNADAKVGYKRPPKHSRFKSGQSGNPKGRPSGTRNVSADLAAVLKERVALSENGKTIFVTKQGAMAKSLVAKAIRGDVRAVEKVFQLLTVFTQNEPASVTIDQVTEEDQRILQLFAPQMMAIPCSTTEAAPDIPASPPSLLTAGDPDES